MAASGPPEPVNATPRVGKPPARPGPAPPDGPAGPPPPPPAAPPERVGDDPPARRRSFAAAVAPCAISTLVHVIVLLLMALIVAAVSRREPPVSMTAFLGDEEAIDAEPLEIEPLDEREFQQPDFEAVPDPGELAIGEVALAGPVVSAADGLDAADAVGGIGGLDGSDLGTGLGGVGDGPGADANVTFFGAKSRGRTFVFVVDNSNSMVKGRFETTMDELVRAVDALGPGHRFYVILFSDTAYGLFHPRTAPGLVPATTANKEKLRAWLYTVEMCLNTRGEAAMKKALSLDPDVINVLGDGAFTDDTAALLTAPHSRRTVINTFGMQVEPKGERQLAAIAAANRGTFHRVDVAPAAARAAKANPIPRNTTRGEVWGLKLPAGK